MNATLLGLANRPKGLRRFLDSSYCNSHHLCMWDHDSLKAKHIVSVFRSVRKCTFNYFVDRYLLSVESEGRINNALALEAIK